MAVTSYRRPGSVYYRGQRGPQFPSTPQPSSAQDTSAQRDALAIIKSVLADYGLESLADWAWQQLVGGLSMNEILISLRERPEFRQRFRAIDEVREAGLPPVSPAEVVAYERQAREMMRANGLPEGFYDDPDDFVNWMKNGVALPELQQRIDLYRARVNEIPAEDRAEWNRLYGYTDGDMLAMEMDPEKAVPAIERRLAASRTAGAAVRSGFGSLSQTEAERLAELGVSQQQAEQGFGTLVRGRELFDALPGSRESSIGRDEQMSAVFGGDEKALSEIERRARRRAASFEGGGSFATSREGFAGLGTAR